jgi:hypothetical protein
MFPNFWKTPQNSRLQDDDKGHVPKTELTNIRRHRRKFSRVLATGILYLRDIGHRNLFYPRVLTRGE